MDVTNKYLQSTAKLLALPTMLVALAACSQAPSPSSVSVEKGDEQYVFQTADGQVLLAYQFATYPAPEGENPAFARSGFYHPVYAPNGQLLTQIQPADHFHHYGVWNPWTHTRFRGKIVDFWNLAKKEGAVRFAKELARENADDHALLSVLHEHVVFNPDGTETIALLEQQDSRVSLGEDPDSYVWDLSFHYRCGTDEPLEIVQYRYGGLGWRATELWNASNSEVLTSEGKTRQESDGSLARWCIVQGEAEGLQSGIILMSHPDNYNHPEPLRIWPEESEGGAVFVNVAPTKTTDWKFEPGKTYTLNYRLLVFSGRRDAAQAEAAWQTFASSR